MDILIIKQTSLGDVLHSTVAIEIIKQNFPESKITFLVDKSAYEILKYNKKIEKFILFDMNILKNWHQNILKTIKHIFNILKEVRKTKYHIAFDLQGLLRSVFFLYFSKADKKYVKGKWLFLEKYRNKNIHAINEIIGVLRKAGLNINNNASMQVFTSQKEKDKIDILLKNLNPTNNKILLINPFSRWKSKDWSLHHYKELLKIIDNNITIIFTGTFDRKDEITSTISESNRPNTINLLGELNLLELTELLKRANLLLSSDGFPIHLAGAFNIPVIALFGPTDENRVGPISDKKCVIRSDIKCIKCYKKNCSPNICMESISPKEVYNKIIEMI